MIKIAYVIALNRNPFSDFPKLVNLLENFKVNMGKSCHERMTCIRMINCVANEMRLKLIRQIVQSNQKISLIVDESDTVAKDSCLIFYISSVFENIQQTFFLTIEKLEQKDSNSIFRLILDTLEKFGLSIGFLNENLIHFVSDGASTFVGSQAGVGKLLKNVVKDLVIWHCIAHRLELSIADARLKFPPIDYLQTVFAQLFSFYSRSSKRIQQIRDICEELGSKFLKIGKIFTIRWIFSSYSSIDSLLKSYDSIYEQMKRENQNMFDQLKSLELVVNLLIFREMIKPIAILSKQLQEKNLNLIDAHKLILICVQKVEELGNYESIEVNEVLRSRKYKGISLVNLNFTEMIDRK